jgi:hypothetical protein
MKERPIILTVAMVGGRDDVFDAFSGVGSIQW